LFIGLDRADVMPLPIIDDDPTNRSWFFLYSSDKCRNDGFDLFGLKKLKDRCLYSIDAGEETALDSGISQGVPKVANLTCLINVYIQKRATAPQDEGNLSRFCSWTSRSRCMGRSVITSPL